MQNELCTHSIYNLGRFQTVSHSHSIQYIFYSSSYVNVARKCSLVKPWSSTPCAPFVLSGVDSSSLFNEFLCTPSFEILTRFIEPTISRWCDRLMCVLRFPFCVNASSQYEHLYGFSPACFFRWTCSAFFWLNALQQISHIKGLSPKNKNIRTCIRWCGHAH